MNMGNNTGGSMQPEMNMDNDPRGEPKSSVGPIVGIVIIIIVLVIGGLYFWGQKLSTDDPDPEFSTSDSQTEELADTSDSDAVDDIDADLDAVGDEDLDALDAELGDIDAELEAALEGLE